MSPGTPSDMRRVALVFPPASTRTSLSVTTSEFSQWYSVSSLSTRATRDSKSEAELSMVAFSTVRVAADLRSLPRGGWRILKRLRRLRVAYSLRFCFVQRAGDAFFNRLRRFWLAFGLIEGHPPMWP